MIEAYKSFLQSSDLVKYIEWIQAIQNDDLAGFLTHFNPDDNPIQELFDPIEVVSAYHADRIFNHLLTHEDYSHFYTPFNLSILQVFAIFKNETYLFKALSKWTYDDDDLMALYDYIIQYSTVSFFKKVYGQYPLHEEEAMIDLLRLSLDNEPIFYYLKSSELFKTYLLDDDVIYDICSYFPQYLKDIESIQDVSFLEETDVMKRMVVFKNEDDFTNTLDFILNRHFDINAYDGTGLAPVHQAIRHAEHIKYLDLLSARGAIFAQKTEKGFPSSHQLYLRDARFILEASHLIDFDQLGPYEKTLADLDDQDEQEKPRLETVLQYTCMALNISDIELYEYSQDDLVTLINHHGLVTFKPSITLIEFETVSMKEAFIERMHDAYFEMIESDQLFDIFQSKFNHEPDKTLQLLIEFDALEDLEEDLSRFALNQQTSFVISSEGYEINQLAHVEWVFSAQEKPFKRAVVYSTLLDIYLLHRFMHIPIENIVYQPIKSGKKHYLN